MGCQTKISEEIIKKNNELIKQGEEMDKTLRELLRKNWKDKTLISEINDSIEINKKADELKLENKTRNR